MRTDPAIRDEDSLGSRIFYLGWLKEGETRTYTITLSPKEAGEFSGQISFFDRSVGGPIGKQLKFANGMDELSLKTTVLAR